MFDKIITKEVCGKDNYLLPQMDKSFWKAEELLVYNCITIEHCKFNKIFFQTFLKLLLDSLLNKNILTNKKSFIWGVLYKCENWRVYEIRTFWDGISDMATV